MGTPGGKKTKPFYSFCGGRAADKINPVQSSWVFQVNPPPSEEAHTKTNAFSCMFPPRSGFHVCSGWGEWGGSASTTACRRGRSLAKRFSGVSRSTRKSRSRPSPTTTPTFPFFSSSNDDQNQVKAPRAGGSISRELLLGRRAPALSCAHS